MRISIEKGVVAIGWSEVGDLDLASPESQTDITHMIRQAHPSLSNSHLGGPSLWNFYKRVSIGDLVILSASGARKKVFEVIGDYFFTDDSESVEGYCHQRAAQLTNLGASQVWQDCGGSYAQGQNQRWTFAQCRDTPQALDTVYIEGGRYEVRSTAIERNPDARAKCLDHYGYSCRVCSFNFEEEFGIEGRAFIHVHHRVDIAQSTGAYKVDPIRDLIPLCPNCHAMAHRKRPAFDIEVLTTMRRTST
ncbi:MAG: HNH endonuclease [Polaromonas sp.]|nr:HNH endonuclease [Polaromonas sp.]